MNLFGLFIIFFKTSLLSFGGGYAMIAMLFDELVKNKFVSEKDFLNIISIAQVTPGPIATNISVFVGYKKYKLIGALISLFGVCLPSFLIAIIFLTVINKLSKSNKFVFIKDIIYGLKAVSASLIFITFIKMFDKSCVREFNNNIFDLAKWLDIKKFFLFLFAFVILYKFRNLNILFVILFFGCAGIIFL